METKSRYEVIATFIILFFVILIVVSVNMAEVEAMPEPISKERCDWTRPATDYRPAKVYEGLGIYGVFTRNGYREIKCFMPGRRRVVDSQFVYSETAASLPIIPIEPEPTPLHPRKRDHPLPVEQYPGDTV